MRALAMMGALTMLASNPAWAERVYTPEGWYEVEEGSGETADSEVAIIVVEQASDGAAEVAEVVEVAGEPSSPSPPESNPREAPPPAGDDEVSRFLRPNCEAVRGEYLRRVLELHGVTSFELIDAETLAVLTRTRPPSGGGGFLGIGGGLGDPALSLLYGEPPVPPGSLSSDFRLQQLALKLIDCLAQVREPPPGKPHERLQPAPPRAPPRAPPPASPPGPPPARASSS